MLISYTGLAYLLIQRTSDLQCFRNLKTNMFAKGISLVRCNIDGGVYNSSPLLDDVFFCIILNVYQHSVIPRLELPFMYLVHKIDKYHHE